MVIQSEQKQNAAPLTCNHLSNDLFGLLTVILSGQIILWTVKRAKTYI